ncbi:MAG: sensor histidine kinase [Geobacter sp.]|nr:sensor histidine kinase [Geobacter sp.]
MSEYLQLPSADLPATNSLKRGQAITRASVEAHGGEVSVHDNPDGGTLFRVRFAPVQAEP